MMFKLIRSKRLAAFALGGVIFISASAICLYFRLARPVGRGPAGPKVAHENFSHPWTSKPICLVGMGDSVTAGFGARRGYSCYDLK